VVGLPARGLAQESAELVALRWEGYGESEGCLGVPSLMARVEDHLGRRAFDSSSSQVVSVSVDRQGTARFRAVVRVLDAVGKVLGERELIAEGSTCSALDEPLVLAVALLVDADLGATPEPEPEPKPPPPPPEPLEIEAPPAAQPRAKEESRPPDPWRLSADFALLGADGVQPSLSAGLEVGFALDPPWMFPLTIHVAGFFPQQVELEPAGSMDFTVAMLGGAACPLSVRPGRFGVDGCLGADLVAQRALSEGLAGARAYSAWFWQGSLRLRFLVDLYGSWYGLLGATVGLPIEAPRFVYRRSGDTVPVFQMSDATLTAGLGVGVRLSP
jgi:hypothetical protein